MDKRTRAKLSPSAAELVDRADTSESLARTPVRLMVQLTHPLDEPTGQRLQQAGLTIQTAAGDVVTARAAPESLENVAAMDDVKYVELSQKVFLE
jgi:hypothetical protein